MCPVTIPILLNTAQNLYLVVTEPEKAFTERDVLFERLAMTPKSKQPFEATAAVKYLAVFEAIHAWEKTTTSIWEVG